MPTRRCSHSLEVPVTIGERRLIMLAAELSRESIADHLRRQLGLVPEQHLTAVQERCERELRRRPHLRLLEPR